MKEEQFNQHIEDKIPILISSLEFEHLPDFLSDHTLMADTPSARINEHARRWTQFVAGLWCDSKRIKVCYQLRYQFMKHEADCEILHKNNQSGSVSALKSESPSSLVSSSETAHLKIRLLIRVENNDAGLTAQSAKSERQTEALLTAK